MFPRLLFLQEDNQKELCSAENDQHNSQKNNPFP